MTETSFWKLTLFLSYYSLSECCGLSIINLNQGRIQGSYSSLGSYWSYLGVPYAGFRGRFKEPGGPPSWNGTFKADRGSLVCKQYSAKTKSVIGEEDCLTLNVYTPISPSNTNAKLLPVMFFIPGGGFYQGSNKDTMFNARYLVQKEVVVVTINYRIGAFGFLCLKKHEAAGNMGLKDQLAALRWVKNNVANFGGDPNSVTMFGQSVGASSVDYFIVTETYKGLFHRAIMGSGTSITIQAFDREPISTASRAASRLGYNTTDPDELLKIYLTATVDDIAKISYGDPTNNALAAYIFKPCIEDPSTATTRFLTNNPQELLKSMSYTSDISVLMGFNSKEGIFWAKNYDCNGLKTLDNNFSSAVPDFNYRKPEYRANLMKDIKEFYFKNSSTNYNALIDYFSDVLIYRPVVATMEAYLTNPNITMYNYYFSYDSLRNLEKMESRLQNVTRGACHADELFYMFDPEMYRGSSPISKDMVMIDTLTDLWTSFAKTGTPSSNNIIWPRSEYKLNFLKLDDEIKVIDLPSRDGVNFWKRAYYNYLQ